MSESTPSPFNIGRGDLQILATCPMCQATFHPLQTRIVAERDDAHLVYLQCRQCGSAVIAMVTTGASGIHSVGTVTDLSRQELLQSSAEAPVTIDQVIDLFEWLEHRPSVEPTLRIEPANS